MSSVQSLNPNADVIGAAHALAINISAARGLQTVIKSNLGPRGTLKMLVSGGGQIKLTKDGKVLLDEMQIQHPTAAIIARTATAQDEITGDGTTSNVLFTGELLSKAALALNENVHPRLIVEGFEYAREQTLEFLDTFKVPVILPKAPAAEAEAAPASAPAPAKEAAPAAAAKGSKKAKKGKADKKDKAAEKPAPVEKPAEKPAAAAPAKEADAKGIELSTELLTAAARSSLRTKVDEELAEHLTGIVVKAIQRVYKPGEMLDLHMVEVMQMQHRTAMDTAFVDGLVLDHGTRHPLMAKRSENCFIFICNISLEYEKSTVNSEFTYKSAEERTKMVVAERKFTDDRVRKIIDLKEQVCQDKPDASFIVVNQKGIDPFALDLFQKAGIVAIRRAKRRNMERLAKACGGYAVNSADDLNPDCLGYAGLVYEHTLGEDKFTFIEGCKQGSSCTVLLKGPNEHTIRQIKDAVRDGLHAVANVIEDAAVVAGAGAFELAAAQNLHDLLRENKVTGPAVLGVQAFAEALKVIPKTLAENAGLGSQEALLKLVEEVSKGHRVGIDLETGKPLLPEKVGIWDCYRVKKQLLHLGSMVAIKLLLVDEIIRAGKKMSKGED